MAMEIISAPRRKRRAQADDDENDGPIELGNSDEEDDEDAAAAKPTKQVRKTWHPRPLPLKSHPHFCEFFCPDEDWSSKQKGAQIAAHRI